MLLIFLAFLIHLMYLASVFDIYFKTPIIHGIPPLDPRLNPPAKRLVLIVADGLRAESIFGPDPMFNNQIAYNAPFLSSVVKYRSTWGISNTRVPTESRPGHVALTAGIYEDPSAVAKGWKENPTDFDSVFNQSRYTWSWGSPDIVPMFTKVSGKHVYAESYSAGEEDFSGKLATSLLDIWVFDKVSFFLKKAAKTERLLKQVVQDKVIFFLHLLGLDTAGHTHKPYSKEHKQNLRIVDRGIEHLEGEIEDFFNDEETAFIFTSDHGMTDWGSHGAGSDMETQTPIIAWGAGIAINNNPVNIRQADIAPLISTLIGIPIPVNSVGVLPIEFLDMSTEDLAYGLIGNAKQIFIQYDIKRARVEKNSIKFLYKPYMELTREMAQEFLTRIEKHLANREFDLAIERSYILIRIATLGLDYYHNYYQRLLLTCISFSYIGWILLLAIQLFETHRPEKIKFLTVLYHRWNDLKYYLPLHMSFLIPVIITNILIYVQSLPFMYFVYCTAPQLLWWAVLVKMCIWRERIMRCIRVRYQFFIHSVHVVLYVVAIEILVYSFFDRKVLTLPLICMSLWALDFENISAGLKLAWMFSTLSLIVFPNLPVVGTQFDFKIIVYTGMGWIVLTLLSLRNSYFIKMRGHTVLDRQHKYLTWFQCVLLVITMFNLESIDLSFKVQLGLTIESQLVSWALLFASVFLPVFGTHIIPSRLHTIMLSFLVPFMLLSVSYEPLFMLCLHLNLMLWLIVEHNTYHPEYHELSSISFRKKLNRRVFKIDRRHVNKQDFRRGYFFLLYIILAFFGTGNMASINSFDPMWVRSFLTIFNPFVMGGLILLKIIIPFLIVSCFFRAITITLQAPVRKLFIIVLIFCDIMGIHFAFLVKNKGSWLEIGTSISHFVIVKTMILFIVLLYLIALLLTSFTLFNFFKLPLSPIHNLRKNV